MLTTQSFDQIFHKGFRSTLRLLVSKGLAIDEAEEYAQAAWSRGWEARHQLLDPTKVLAWINGIAINYMRNDKRRNWRISRLDDCSFHPAQEQAPVLENVDLEKLLDRCSKLDRSLLIEHYVGGLDMGEVANQHGMSNVATRVRIHRARAALRRFATAQPEKSAA